MKISKSSIKLIIVMVVSAVLCATLMLSGCANRSSGTNESTNVADSSAAAEDEEAFQQALDEWVTAWDSAEEGWASLQTAISESEAADKEFQSLTVKNPDALTAFESVLSDAKAVENQHEDMAKQPEDISGLESGAEALGDIADAYSQKADELTASKNAVEVTSPNEGEFDITMMDGYSYHVKYNMNAEFSVDTTEGKPGQVALYMDVSNCVVTVTNTTPGKKAPPIRFYVDPLYNPDLFEGVLFEGEDVSSEQFGVLSSPSTFAELIQSRKQLWERFPEDLAYNKMYVNPFHSARNGAEIVCMDEGYWSDFEVGESRDMSLFFKDPRIGQNYLLGMIGENEEVDKFNMISGWAVAAKYSEVDSVRYRFADETQIFVVGQSTRFAYPYNPIGGK
jgi:outer membrane murein-binding lipoprotein Lpp